MLFSYCHYRYIFQKRCTKWVLMGGLGCHHATEKRCIFQEKCPKLHWKWDIIKQCVKNLRKMRTFQSARKRPKRVKCARFDSFSKNDSLRVCYSDIVIIVIYSRDDPQNGFKWEVRDTIMEQRKGIFSKKGILKCLGNDIFSKNVSKFADSAYIPKCEEVFQNG